MQVYEILLSMSAAPSNYIPIDKNRLDSTMRASAHCFERSLAVDFHAISEGSLGVGDYLDPSAVGEEGSEGTNGDDDAGSNAGLGPGRERIQGGGRLGDDVAEAGGLLGAVLLHHFGLAAQFLVLPLSFVDLGGNGGIDLVILVDADGAGEPREERTPVIDFLTVGSVLLEVSHEIAVLEGDLDLEVIDGSLAELFRVDVEIFENSFVVGGFAVEICQVEGGLGANGGNELSESLVRLVPVVDVHVTEATVEGQFVQNTGESFEGVLVLNAEGLGLLLVVVGRTVARCSEAHVHVRFAFFGEFKTKRLCQAGQVGIEAVLGVVVVLGIVVVLSVVAVVVGSLVPLGVVFFCTFVGILIGVVIDAIVVVVARSSGERLTGGFFRPAAGSSGSDLEEGEGD